MSKRQIKTAASSGRVAGGFGGFGSSSAQTSSLSYIQEPLDYSSLDDPVLGVTFKNLGKKDETTKVKALDELSIYLESHPDVAPSIADLWVRLFPRLSIDDNRRVRQSTQSTNGKLCAQLGKKTAKYLPQLIGPWLAAQYDSDKSVSRAAREALASIFPDAAKLEALWDVFTKQIIDYCKSTVLHETVDTLSDQRTVSAEDAELVYARTIAGALELTAALLQRLSTEKIDSISSEVDSLADEQTIDLAIHKDPALRRAVHQLVATIANKKPSSLENRQKLLSNFYVYKALTSDQSGSRIAYLDAMTRLTKVFPEIWTSAYSGKKPAVSRLCQFLETGSQSGSTAYWEKCSALLEALPLEQLAADTQSRSGLLDAVRKAASSREDRNQNAAAWQSYFQLQGRLSADLEANEQHKLFEAQIMPVITSFAISNPDAELWQIRGSGSQLVLSRWTVPPAVHSELKTVVTTSTTALVDAMKASQPEQSKSFEQSQNQVAEQGRKQAQLYQALLCNTSLSGDVHECILDQIKLLTDSALNLLKDRNGKPFGAAAVVESVLQHATMRTEPVKLSLQSFTQQDLPALLFSPSAARLVQISQSVCSTTELVTLIDKLLTELLRADQSVHVKLTLLLRIIPKDCPAAVQETLKASTPLQALLQQAPAELVVKYIQADIASEEASSRCIEALGTELIQPDHTATSLQALSHIASKDANLLTTNHVSLLASILELRDSPEDEVADLAKLLAAKLSTKARQVGNDPAIIQRAIADQKLPISDVIELANTYLDETISIKTLQDCLPPHDWKAALASKPAAPDDSLAISSPFGSFVHMVTHKLTLQLPQSTVRLATCATLLVSRVKQVTDEQLQDLSEILLFCSKTIAARSDELDGCGNDSSTEESSLRTAIATFMQTLSASQLKAMLTHSPQEKPDDLSSSAYYAALAKHEWLALRSDQSTLLDSLLPHGDLARASIELNPFALAAILACEQPPQRQQDLLKLVNQLIASITASELISAEDNKQLFILSTCMSANSEVLTGVAKQRIVFLIQHLLKSLDLATPITREAALKILLVLLPTMADMYGEHWTDALTIVSQIWTSPVASVGLPSLYASLKLYDKLEKLGRKQDANEDLLEALQKQRPSLAEDLVNLLISIGEAEINTRPFQLLCELLARIVSGLESVPQTDTELIYPLLYANSPAVQTAALRLLQVQIKGSVEELSVEAALSKKTARLPGALLSSVLSTPSLHTERTTALQTYLNSWRLIFEHMRGASFKVQSDYADQLKDGQFIGDLLSLIYTGLGLTMAKPVDLTRYDLAEYDDQAESDPVKNEQWLFGHMYFLSLRYLPSLVKTSMLEIRNRGLPATIESWTSKHISPILISESLADVSRWAKSTVDEDPEYEKMQVLVGTKSKEVNVKYTVDEQTMAIKVVLPEAYPLASAQVIGVNRVAVKEDQWQAWLRNCQGVITFSNGSISDGLSAWRKNVTGALKGQTECAICYSIISADKQLPTKKCPTCKNLFHSSCLFKWFKTSNASTCPLCRNPFNFN